MKWDAIILNAADNVATVLRPLAAGEEAVLRQASGDARIVSRQAVPLCHKIALVALASGDPVLKYGECIGEASTAIAAGDWVHIHNIVSRRGRR
jgi:altronate dehydratase small subunit